MVLGRGADLSRLQTREWRERLITSARSESGYKGVQAAKGGFCSSVETRNLVCTWGSAKRAEHMSMNREHGGKHCVRVACIGVM